MLKTLRKQTTPAEIVRSELLRREMKLSDLAKHVGLTPKSCTNTICGNNISDPARHRIENFLGLPIWSTSEEFAARQNSPEQKECYIAALQARLASTSAAQFNFGTDLQKIAEQMGITIIALQLDGDKDKANPVWNQPDLKAIFREELLNERCGSWESAMTLDGCIWNFYHVATKTYAKAVRVIVKALNERGLQDRARVFLCEPESGWTQYHPPTGWHISTK